ncbi:MAG TPA: hypothetical protein VKB38_08910 [Terracidiphilus sp.]|nr:hypothetical protein [Terracidiphilus sp.]
MTTHPYLRAYLAGVLVPTLILPLGLVAFVVVRLCLAAPFPVERAAVFPLALIPAVWGLWNVLWLGTRPATHLSVGAHGAVLPLLLLPAGTLIATQLGVLELGATHVTWFQAIHVPYALIAAAFAAVLAMYYLVWKYIVGFVNRTLDVA